MNSNEILFEGSPSAKALRSEIIKFSVLSLLIVGIPKLIQLLINIKTTKYKCTKERLEVEKGLVSKKINNLELWRIKDIQFTQSITQRIFGECSITLETQDTTTPYIVIDGFNSVEGRKIYDQLSVAAADGRKSNRVTSIAT